jgi:hypothetical protein
MKLTAALLTLAALTGVPVGAEDTKSGSITTKRNKTYQYERTRTGNGDGTASTQGSITGPNGAQATTAGTATRTENGVRSEGTVTRPDGRQGKYEGSTTNNGDGTYTRQRSYTGAQGGTSQVNSSGNKESGTRTATGANGKSRTRNWNKK